MALATPTTQELYEEYISNFEASLSQTAPLQDQSFLNVMAATEALNHISLYKYAVERALQNLAITATGEDLDRIGAEYNVNRKAAEAAVLTIDLPADNGTVIPTTVSFIGDGNGVRYFPDSQVTATGGSATISVTAEETGAIGNLNVSDTLTISRQIAGAENQATVTSLDNTGADEEEEEAYRERVLNAIRNTTGGGNNNDYKVWSEGVAGVFRAYPYAGIPYDEVGTEYPGDRTVYVQCTEDVQVDGIAPSSLLDEVRDAINEDPDTGQARAPLGHIDGTLDVYAIRRTDFNVTITGLIVDATQLGAAQNDISSALSTYFRETIRPFVPGIDLTQDQNDTVTPVSISEVVQDVMNTYGGSARDVAFDTGGGSLTDYTLGEGELGDLGTITYA